MILVSINNFFHPGNFFFNFVFGLEICQSHILVLCLINVSFMEAALNLGDQSNARYQATLRSPSKYLMIWNVFFCRSHFFVAAFGIRFAHLRRSGLLLQPLWTSRMMTAVRNNLWPLLKLFFIATVLGSFVLAYLFDLNLLKNSFWVAVSRSHLSRFWTFLSLYILCQTLPTFFDSTKAPRSQFR